MERADPAGRTRGRSRGPPSDYPASACSEMARAPGHPVGRKHRIGTGDRALAQLGDAPGPLQGPKSIAAEIDRAEIRGIELEIGACSRTPCLSTVGTPLQLDAAAVPGTELVANAEHQAVVDGITAAGERLEDIDQAHPEAVFDSGLGLPRVGQQKAQRLVNRPHLGRHPGSQVHAQDVAPERGVRLRAGRDQHLESQRPVRARGVPIHLDAIDREAGWAGVILVEHAIVRAGALAVQLEVGEKVANPPLIQPQHAGLAARRLLPGAGECRDRRGHIDQRQLFIRARGFSKGGMSALDLDRRLIRGEAITEATVDRRLRGIERGQRFATLVYVVELSTHHRRQQPPPAMGAQHTDPGHAGAGQKPAGDGELVGKDARGGDDLRAIEKRERAVELGDLAGCRQFLVGWQGGTEGTPHHRRVGALFLRPYRPELEVGGCGYRWTSARARHGLPEPLTSLRGATTRTAPVGGSVARLASWVSPYLFAPSRNWWQGNGGLKEWAVPASVPTVSTPTPTSGLSLASHFASSMSIPGVCGPVSLALRNAF